MRASKPTLSCDAVFFDATGTLFFPHPSVGAVYAAVAMEHGLEADSRALDTGFRAAWRERASHRFGQAPDYRTSDRREKQWWRGTVGRTFEHAGLPAPGRGLFEAIFARFADPVSWRLFPDALPTIAALRHGGLRVGIVSNFDTRLRHIVAGVGLGSAVDFVVTSAEVGAAKPSSRIFDAAVHLVGVPPGRALMVGDSAKDDVAGARAAGCQAILLDREGHRGGPGVIRCLSELTGRSATRPCNSGDPRYNPGR